MVPNVEEISDQVSTLDKRSILIFLFEAPIDWSMSISRLCWLRNIVRAEAAVPLAKNKTTTDIESRVSLLTPYRLR